MHKILNRVITTWKILVANKMRTVLTLLGIVIGISSVIVLMSLGNGVKESITSEITSFGANNIVISPEVGPSSGQISELKMNDVRTIEAVIDNLDSEITWQSTAKGIISYGANSATVTAIGIIPSYAEVNDTEITTGRLITRADEDELARVVILGSTISNDLFEKESSIGKQIVFNKVSFTVIGILKESGSGFTSNDNSILIPISTMQTYINGNNNISQITINVKNKDHVEMLMNKVEAYLRVSRGIKNGDDSDFKISNFSSLLDSVNNILSTLTAFLSAIAAISLLVGGIGIMNIMFVSVSERTKEIGLRKALGANKNDILIQFLVEAIVVTILGGLIGLLLGVILAIILSSMLGLSLGISIQAILLALGVSVSIGVIFGIYPARKAAELTPIDALRFE